MNNKNKKISLVSLGCAKNLVDSEVLVGGLKYENFEIVDKSTKADIIIINTCGFLESAREESIDVILEAGELRKINKIEKLIVMGCFSGRYGQELMKELPEVDAFFGTDDHAKIISYLLGKPFLKQDPDYYRSILTPSHYAYLKIAEGCDNGCAFCSIPLFRGTQKSQPVEWNVQETTRLVNAGVKEIMVIAQDTTSYGWDLDDKASLHQLIKEIDQINNLEWLRLHYAHPAHLHREMIKLYSYSEKLLPYIDMPVQHASDKILKKMRRGLNSDGIRSRIDNLRDANPNIVIRSTMIVGFPDETEDDFQKLYDFVDEVQFDRLGLFTYSEEPGTYGGENYKDNIPLEVKTERMDAIMMLQQEINMQKNKKLIGSTQKVLIDKYFEEGWTLGRTYRDSPEVDNYVRINEKLNIGEFYNIEIKDATAYELIGKKI